MRELRLAWRGPDLFDSIEEEGMALSARASQRVACEIVSTLRLALGISIAEPLQEDSWSSFDFSLDRTGVRCAVSFADEDEYLVALAPAAGLLRALFGRRASPLDPRLVDRVREALAANPRLELLAS